jgi:glycosyltransferase involved in cell wall biosynthesis
MSSHTTKKQAASARRPLRVMFITTRMAIGGEEVLLVELIRRLDRQRFAPELCCLKFLGELGQMLSQEVPVATGLLRHKFDIRVLGRLTCLLRQRQIDAVVTVGTGGDRMFWGRWAARRAGVPVVLSALHSTGWPTRVEWPNRCLTPWTDAFIAVSEGHGRHIAAHEGCPKDKIRVVPNGVDTSKFRPSQRDVALLSQLGLPVAAPVVGVVAEMRPEKNLQLWLRTAAEVRKRLPDARFLIVGDGQQRQHLESLAVQLGLADAALFCGRRRDIPKLLPLMDAFLLTSDMEAKPVSILEAMSSSLPVVSTDVGSNREMIADGKSGYLVPAGDLHGLTQRVVHLLRHPSEAQAMGVAARNEIIAHHSVERMVQGYEHLLENIYELKSVCHLPAKQAANSPALTKLQPALRRPAAVAIAKDCLPH